MRCLVILLAVFGLVTMASASPLPPPPPETYEVQVRYRINLPSETRPLAHRAMLDAMKKAGFTRTDKDIPDTEPIDPDATRMNGLVPSKNVDKLRNIRYVQALLLYPKDAKFPEKERVRVDLTLASGYAPKVQHTLWRQTTAALGKLDFVPAFGYDHRDYTRLVGSVMTETLDKLLEDARLLVPTVELQRPLRGISPVLVVLSRPDWPAPPGRPKDAPPPAKEAKFTSDLRTALAAKKGLGERLEVILDNAPTSNDGEWRRNLSRVDVAVEGRLGPIVTVSTGKGLLGTAAERIAEIDEVLAIRLPRSGRVALLSGDVPDKWEPLRPSGLTKLHAIGRKGKGTRVALVADDFTGWEKLPGKVALFDLTAERSLDLLPGPFPTGAGKGAGTRNAEELLRAAPEAELTLIRVAADAPYMVEIAARGINGDKTSPLGLEQRLRELQRDRESLDLRRDEVQAERRRVLDERVEKTPEGLDAMAVYKKNQKEYDEAEKAWSARFRRFLKFQEDLKKLHGIRVVASTLAWTDGYPVDGGSALSRYFDDRPFRAALWFQAAGDTGGQAWTGPYRDADENQLVEMGEARRLPADGWTTEVNFLDWRDGIVKPKQLLPAATRLRLSLQWREAHDPLPVQVGEDPDRQPLANVKLGVVRQLDPKGEKRPSDDLEVLKVPVGVIQRLEHSAASSTYEYSVDLDLAAAGRYGVFIEGKQPESIHPPGENVLPAMRKKADLNLRLFVKTLTPGGRAAWNTFETRTAALGMPADAREVLAVAAVGPDGKLRLSSAAGPPFGRTLAKKPEVAAYDSGEGTSGAAAFAAGLTATAATNKGGVLAFGEALRERPGALLVVPQQKR